jgi:hypothetical protein
MAALRAVFLLVLNSIIKSEYLVLCGFCTDILVRVGKSEKVRCLRLGTALEGIYGLLSCIKSLALN